MGCVDMSPYRGVCGCCVSLFKWIPVIVITGIVGWSYYAYVVKLCILTIESDIEKAVLLVLYHIFITFFLVSKMAEFTVFFVLIIHFQSSYWRTVWTRPGDIPKKFRLSPDELDHVEGCDSEEDQRRLLEQIVIDKDLPVAMRTIQVISAYILPFHTRCLFCAFTRGQCGIVRSALVSSQTELIIAQFVDPVS